MKIAILTLIGEFNYGNLLQSYALQTILKSMGHRVIVLNRRNSAPSLKLYCLRIMSFVKSIILRYLFKRTDVLIVSPFVENCDYDIRNRIDKFHLKRFTKRYINRSSALRSSNDISKYACRECFDAYVVGSDQVWREAYTFSIDEMFLSFLSDGSKAIRIAYAASFGVNDGCISKERMPKCVELLKKFVAVSVREKSAVKICEEHFGVEAKHVLDPTMLLSIEDYIKIFERDNTPKSKGNLLVYILDDSDEIKQEIKSFSIHNQFIPFKVNELEKVQSKSYAYKLPSIEAWLRGFYDAEFVITDSFHACVFSIIFRKPFICIGNKGRGSARFESLLSMFGLEDRLVDISDIDDVPLNPINWQYVEEILMQKKEAAIAFIKNSLDK